MLENLNTTPLRLVKELSQSHPHRCFEQLSAGLGTLAKIRLIRGAIDVYILANKVGENYSACRYSC